MGRVVLSGVLLDTHTLVWLLEGNQRLGPLARDLTDSAVQEDNLLVSAISFWEVAMLTQRHRLELSQPPELWRRAVLALGVAEIPVSGDIAIRSTEFQDFPVDPADRIIAATALTHDATLVTADSAILDWTGQLRRHDARN